MILHDHWCKFCGNDFEALVEWDQQEIPCPSCGKWAQRYFKSGCTNSSFVVDPAWLKTVHDVMDKEDRTPEAVEFRTHPTRANYKAWMKAKGLRPLEPGEERRKPSEVDRGRIVEYLAQRLQQHRSISI